MLLQFRRRAGGRNNGAPKTDFRVYRATVKASGSVSVGIRIDGKVLKQCRWMKGDYVASDYDVASGTWILRPSDSKSGNVLSAQGKKGDDLTVRFIVDRDHLRLVGLDVVSGYDCSAVEVSSEMITFRKV